LRVDELNDITAALKGRKASRVAVVAPAYQLRRRSSEANACKPCARTDVVATDVSALLRPVGN
jgi:hypothetical protein